MYVLSTRSYMRVIAGSAAAALLLSACAPESEESSSLPDQSADEVFVGDPVESLATTLGQAQDVEPPVETVQQTRSDNVWALPGSTPVADLEPVDYAQWDDLVIPPLRPEDALERFKLEDGFTIELVAHEPMIVDLVAMDIDADGRLWVIEMPSYMPVHDMSDAETSIRERVPQGRIVVLEDTTGDGMMDHRTIFRAEMILPRSIKVLDHGVLVAEPPNLWYIEDTNGDGYGDKRTIIHDRWGNPDSDNVEHMPNGLMWAMDNWMYSSHSGVDRYRKTARGEFERESFRQLGQWGMTQDDWGRLFSAHNSRMLLSHIPPHGYGAGHGKEHSISESERVWPAHVTGVNRGYRINNEVWEDGTLRQTTATCGPVIYRGGLFGDEYLHNAFIPEPAGNLIKRLILEDDPGVIEHVARFAYSDREFLTSTDERFRPVNMYNAPDGSLYVVDIYRGLFQHARFLTDHLRDYAVEHDLHRPSGQFGRIYRIRPTEADIDYNTPQLSTKSPVELVEYLTSPQGQIRDAAQQLLVQRSPEQAISALESLATDHDAPATSRMHAIWTLDGFNREVISLERLASVAVQAMEDPHPRVRAHAVRILEPALAQDLEGVLDAVLVQVEREQAPWTRLQMLASLPEASDERAIVGVARLIDQGVDNPYFRDMAQVRMRGRELEIAQALVNHHQWSDEHGSNHARDLFEHFVGAADGQIERDPMVGWTDAQRARFAHGADRYATCAACHGAQGEGMARIATALAGSDWVIGDADNLIRIVLHGFTGGAEERDEEIFTTMPPHGSIGDEDLAAMITYIRNAWGNEAGPVSPEQIEQVREAHPDRTELWTPDQLRDLE